MTIQINCDMKTTTVMLPKTSATVFGTSSALPTMHINISATSTTRILILTFRLTFSLKREPTITSAKPMIAANMVAVIIKNIFNPFTSLTILTTKSGFVKSKVL